jgi:tripartite ATP-independent transporter DctM subunit
MLLSIACGGFLVFMLLGMPIVFALGASSMLALGLASDISLLLVPQRMIAQIDSFALLAVPFFVLAGMVMEQGGISARLVHFATCLVGHFRGGLAMVCIVSSMIFAGVSGSTSADAAAIGAILIPAMIVRGYDRAFVASLQAAAATMGPIIPPSTLAIIYASLTNVSVGKLFLAGIVPGIMIGLALMIATHFYATRLDYPVERRATLKETMQSMRDSFWALMVPVVILGGIVSGVFTATESGAIAAVYALIVALFIYRELSWRDLPQVLLRSCLTTALVMIVIASAGVFSWILANENLPDLLRVFLLNVSTNQTVVLFIMLALMTAIGCVMEIVAAAMIMIPVLFPIARQLGIDDVHFGLLIMLTMALGAVTPPVGVTLYITLGLAGTSLSSVNKYIWPLIGVLLVILILCALFPPLVTFIPNLLLG